MPKKIITALDLETAARLGKKEFAVKAEDVITDVAKERAEQLEIQIIKVPPGRDVPEEINTNKSTLNEMDHKTDKPLAAAAPVNPTLRDNNSLQLFQDELEKIKNEIELLKTNSLNMTQKGPDGASGAVSAPISRSSGVLTTAKSPAMEADLVIKNGNLVIPRLGVFQADLEIAGRKISSISMHGQSKGKKTIDASGLYVMPGVIDPHIHLGIFGDLKEEIEKESASALLGGVTSAGCFLYSEDSYFDYLPAFVDAVEQHSFIDIFPHLVITTPRQVEEIPAYIRDLKITSFKIYMCGVPGLIPHMSDDKILDVFEKVKGYQDVSISIHAENPHIVEWSLAQHLEEVKRDNDLLAWSKTRPSLAEEEAVKRAVLLAERYGVSIYLVHLSARESLDVIRSSRLSSNAYALYAETTSPYLTIDTGWELGARGKMVPPFRTPEHRESLWEGIKNGVIDTVGTDNVTLTLAEKKPDLGMAEALPGYPALATHLPSMLHDGVNNGRITLTRLSEVTSLRPAEIFGLNPPKGSLLPGSDADVVIVNLQERRTVDPLKLASRADFSLYEGKELTGWPVYTVKSGDLVMQRGELLTAAKKSGMVIRRAPTS